MTNSRLALITGCNGFCGRSLITQLADVKGMRVAGTHFSGVARPNSLVSESVALDIRQQSEVERVVARLRPQLVFHLAAAFEGSADQLYQTNFLGTLYLLDALRRYAPDARILLVGSAAEYGHVPEQEMPITEKRACVPLSPYAASKYASTLLGREYVYRFGMKVVMARPFNIVGAGMPANLLGGAILQRARQALEHEGDGIVKVGNLESSRDFVAVEDVTAAYIKMIHGDYWGEVFNLCSGTPTPVRDLAVTLLSSSERPLRMETDPALLRTVDPSSVYGSFAKANAAFGFKPAIPLKDSLKVAWTHAMEEAVRCE